MALAQYGPSAVIVHGRFSELGSISAQNGFEKADLILFDFGLSSNQIDDPQRGFSFQSEGPLDMRMNPSTGLSAAKLVNESDAREIERILREFGEEKWARRIALFIVARRPLRTTRDLVEAIEAAVPRAAWPKNINVATRTFQGLRIAVNDELEIGRAHV